MRQVCEKENVCEPSVWEGDRIVSQFIIGVPLNRVFFSALSRTAKSHGTGSCLRAPPPGPCINIDLEGAGGDMPSSYCGHAI